MVVHCRSDISVGCMSLVVHSGNVFLQVCMLVCSSDLESHCSGLSNTESGSTEIFSFFSGQLYSFGNFVYTKRKNRHGETCRQLNKTKQKLKYRGFTCLLTSV